MSNRVAPSVEVFQVFNSTLIPSTLRSYLVQEFQTQAIEVGTDVARIRIPTVEFAV